MNYLHTFYLFMSLVIGGVLLEVFLSQFHYLLLHKKLKKYHFSLGRYLFLLLFPIIAGIIVLAKVGSSLVIIFLTFALVGTLLEWLIGFSYHMVIGKRLWTYYRYNITSYTSLLSIPFWGLAGIMFWLLARIF